MPFSMNRFFSSLVFVVAVALSASTATAAELRLSPVFGDHMVLQRDKPVKIWGWGDKEEVVTVRFAGQKLTTTVQANGSWLVTLEPMKASADPRDLVISGKGERTQKCVDVLVGEVWLLGGQSNMEMPLWWRGDGLKNAEGTRLVLDTDHPWLRIMTVPQRALPTPQDTFPRDVPHGESEAGKWFVSKSRHKGISGFSALGYYIALGLHEKLDVPIGMVDTSWGGTIASAWVSRDILETIPEATEMVKKKETAAAEWSEEKARKQLALDLADWEKRVAIAKAEKKNIPGKPSLKTDPAQDRNFPSAPFNAMIWPLRHMTLRGVFFYQGENNYFDRVDPFEKTFPAVATSWRNTFGDKNLPVCLFQICGWERKDMLYWQTKLPIIQEQQHQAHLSLPNTGFVITMDHPHVDIHPMKKRPIAERAVRWAKAEVYGEKSVTWGTPVFQSQKQEKNRLILKFKTPGDEKLKITGEPVGFVIAGKDGKFVEAKAEVLDGTSVAVWSEKVAEPMMVRYAWSQRAICNLYTESGLPVGPFRTDKGTIPPSEIMD